MQHHITFIINLRSYIKRNTREKWRQFNFQAVMNFMSTQGDLNVLSSPRVTAANNQKAVIKVGEDQYFVTDIDGEVGSGDDARSEEERKKFSGG